MEVGLKFILRHEALMLPVFGLLKTKVFVLRIHTITSQASRAPTLFNQARSP